MPEAAYYRFGYVNMVADFPAAEANGDWMEAFSYVDQVNRGQTSYTFRRLEPGVYHAFAVLTNNSRYGEPTWPANPAWQSLTVPGGGTGTPPPATPGAAAGPTGLSAVPGPDAGQVSLTWTPLAGAALHLVWSTRPDGTGSRWHDAGAGSAVISGLEAGLEYSFAVVAGYASSGGEIARWSAFSSLVRATAPAATPPPTTASAIAAGGKHSCMLQSDGAAVCWGAHGDADRGQADPPAGVTFTAISAGYEHTCGIASDGAARRGAGALTPPARLPPPPALSPPLRPAAPTPAPCGITERRYAGAATSTASGTLPPACPSARSPPAASTAAAGARTGGWNAGATTTTARPRRPTPGSTPSARGRGTPAASSVTGALPAGAPTRTGKRRRRWTVRTRRLAPAGGPPAR